MNRFFVCFLLIAVPFISLAQQKTFTHSQIFRGEYPDVMKDLPEIHSWLDDEHYIEIRKDKEGKETSFSIQASSGTAMPFEHTADKELPNIEGAKNPTHSPDGRSVAFTRDNNLFVMDVATKKETQLTTDGSDVILNGFASWIYYEEILGRSSEYRAFWWSPDSKKIAYMRFDDTEVPVFPIYVADGQHGYLEQHRYPKVGDKNPTVKIGITPIDKPATIWADFNDADDQYFGMPHWTPGNDLLVQWMNRDQDSLKVYRLDMQQGKKTLLYSETQPTWVTLTDPGRFFFLTSNKGFILKSDKDGWDNLYLHDQDGKLINVVTTGNFWDTEILAVDEKNKQVFLRARKENSARFDVYRASFNGKQITRLSFGNFTHDAVKMSPTGKYFISTYSNLSSPPATALVNNKGKLVRELGNSKGPEYDQYQLPQTRMVTVNSADSKYALPMTITYPLHFDSTKKYPVWISVYGGPNSGTVFDRWKPAGGLTQWWAQEGVIQVAMDNRSSGHFGRKGINEIFKQMGLKETEDYMQCAGWLKKQPWADTSRIGINGGSFGGYMTCMALTYGAGYFTHGIASYSVTDWRLYDTHYTERFMNTVADNEEGYEKTSPLTYLNRYKGLLRIVHGSTDDNVHMQNSIQMIGAMQDRNMNLEVMIYPNQRHGISGSKGWHNLVETCKFVYRYMLEKELPKAFRP